MTKRQQINLIHKLRKIQAQGKRGVSRDNIEQMVLWLMCKAFPPNRASNVIRYGK